MSTDFGTRTAEEEAGYRAALERAEMLQGYYIHLLVYLVVNTGLFLINLLTKGESGTWWFYWPLIGWGIALGIHALVTFVIEGPFGSEWEDRKIKELIEHDRATIHGSSA